MHALPTSGLTLHYAVPFSTQFYRLNGAQKIIIKLHITKIIMYFPLGVLSWNLGWYFTGVAVVKLFLREWSMDE